MAFFQNAYVPVAFAKAEREANASGLADQPEKRRKSLIETYDIAIVELTNSIADLGFRKRQNLVDHNARREFEPVGLAWLNGYPEKRDIGRISGKAAKRHRIEIVEMLMLNDDNRARLAAIIGSACAGPNFAPGQTLFQSSIESAHAWSVAA